MPPSQAVEKLFVIPAPPPLINNEGDGGSQNFLWDLFTKIGEC